MMRMFIPLVSSVYHVPTPIRLSLWATTPAAPPGLARCAAGGDNFATGNLGYDADAAKDIGDDEHPYTKGDINLGKDVLMSSLSDRDQDNLQAVCALTTEGKVRCWGSGNAGALGNNGVSDITPSSFPPPDLAFTSATVIKIDLGVDHGCAVLNTGAVRCWGSGADGALGTDATANLGDDSGEIEALTDINVGATVIDVSAANSNTCVVTTDHRGRCWGNNRKGELGRDNTTNVGNGNSAPNNMASLSDIAIGADDPKIVKILINNNAGTTCAQTEAGGLRCWGYGAHGRLGTGATNDIGNDGTPGMISVTDVDLEAPADTVDSADLVVTDFSVAQFFCVLNSAGQVKCVGRNEYGQLGIGNTTDTGTGTGADYSWMDFGSKVVALASGAYDSSDTHTCALTESGEIYCWGVGTGGALGYARTEDVGDNELPTDLAPYRCGDPCKSISRHRSALKPQRLVRFS